MAVTSFPTRKREETLWWGRYANLSRLKQWHWQRESQTPALLSGCDYFGSSSPKHPFLVLQGLNMKSILPLPACTVPNVSWIRTSISSRNNPFGKDQQIPYQHFYVTTFISLLAIIFYEVEDFGMVSCDFTPYTLIQMNMPESQQMFHACKEFLFTLLNIQVYFSVTDYKESASQITLVYFPCRDGKILHAPTIY